MQTKRRKIVTSLLSNQIFYQILETVAASPTGKTSECTHLAPHSLKLKLLCNVVYQGLTGDRSS